MINRTDSRHKQIYWLTALIGMFSIGLLVPVALRLALRQPLVGGIVLLLLLVGALVGGGLGWRYLYRQEQAQEQAESATAQRQQEGEQRALLAAIPDAVVRLNRAGVYLEIKAPTDFHSVLPVAQMLGKRQSEVLPAAMAAQFKTHIAQALETQQLQVFEYTVVIEGELRHREARIVPVNQTEVVAILRDITQRKQAETALRQSEARYRALLQAVPDAITRINRQGIYLDAKPPTDFTTVTDLTEVIGKKVRDVFAPALAQQIMQHIDLALTTGKIQTFEIDVESDGQRRLREIRVVPSGPDEVTTIARDFTTRREAEAQRSQAVTNEQQIVLPR